MKTTINNQNETTSKSIDEIHKLMEDSSHYPCNLQSGWLPKPGHSSMAKFFSSILEKAPIAYAPCIEALDQLFKESPVMNYLIESACNENQNLYYSDPSTHKDVTIPRIKDKNVLLNAFNHILTTAPAFIDDALVGLPFSAFVVGIDPTLSGSEMFRMPVFNEKMSVILSVWNKFLTTEASNVGFRIDGEQWLSDVAKKQYDFPIWKKDSETLPYWSSWNSFFTRKFTDRYTSRPVADQNSNKTVICPNDGSLFRWRENIKRKDTFWFKDMNYSLADILSSPIPWQQAIIDEHNLVDIFEGGYIFQTYLNPYNFHRWWVPVNGTAVFTPFTVPGCFFNKLVLPDYGGGTTASLPYLAQVNARGIAVFDTGDYGRVCCIPLGMSEVSSVDFDSAIVENAMVTKGQPMGTFNYGGSSFVIIYEKLPGKTLEFVNAAGKPYEKNPPLPGGSSGTGDEVTWIGSQIGIWKDA
jgi:phosphatidylserine decarboxylase